MKQFISKEVLDELSYCSSLGQSLKQISLSKTPIEKIIQDCIIFFIFNNSKIKYEQFFCSYFIDVNL